MTKKRNYLDGKFENFDRVVRRLPRILRLLLGFILIAGGIFGFLPILGFWMVPLGLAVLAIDIPLANRVWVRMRAFLLKWTGQSDKEEDDQDKDKEETGAQTSSGDSPSSRE